MTTGEQRVTAERFWNKVDQSGECWPWQSWRNTRGYGEFSIGGRTHKAHRVAWQGVIPAGVQMVPGARTLKVY